jgi:hypothetical protein
MSSHHAFVRLSMPLLTELENHLLASLAINMALLTELARRVQCIGPLHVRKMRVSRKKAQKTRAQAWYPAPLSLLRLFAASSVIDFGCPPGM